tara:strand:- start:7347 stop:12473 length:5127 start_codon:yes stop_codon:yes gene_type:complete
MADINTNFIAGKMNKSVDERLMPPGEYVDALNVRLGSTETTEIGAVENSKGNTQITNILYKNERMVNAICIGAYADGINQNMYWFLHDPLNGNSLSGKVDMILSYNASTNATKYIVISENVLNFNSLYLITGVNLIGDLLFFTDNFNPPRSVNINRDYGYPTTTDGFVEEDISLIVKPPGFGQYTNNLVLPPQTEFILPAPKLALFQTPSQEENYIKDKFLCFAYRFKYLDGQYSATSLYTTPAFEPSEFSLDYDTLTNAGMENKFNTIEITFSTGPKNVIGIDLLYKESGKSTIFLIEKYNKSEEGWADDSFRSINFGKRKVYTLLGEDELLRTFDNVPLVAQAQTVMGNRVMFGNYIDGRDMVDADGLPVAVDYTVGVQTFNDEYVVLKNPTRIAGSQNWNISATQFQSTLGFNTFYANETQLGGNVYNTSDTIIIGTSFSWEIQIRTTGTESITQNVPNFPTAGQYSSSTAFEPIFINFEFTTQNSYNSINTMLNSSEFSDAVGVTNFQPITNSNNGNTLTDRFNSVIIPPGPNNQGKTSNGATFIQTEHSLTGITSSTISEGWGLVVTGDTFELKVPAVEYTFTDLTTNLVSRYYEYFQTVSNGITGTLDTLPNRLSLHSNRDYSVGIIYMDEYGRSSTVLTNTDDTVHIPTSGAGFVNRLQVSISNPPPVWATRYKFAIKPSATTYDTIYITTYTRDFFDPALFWFRLIGQDQALVSAGDTLIVKMENFFVFPSLVTLEVLEVEVKGRGEIDGVLNNLGNSLPGLYFSAKPSGFNPSNNTEIYAYNTVSVKQNKANCGTNPEADQQAVYPVHSNATGSGTQINYQIKQGSVIQFDMKITRSPYNGGLNPGDPDDNKSVDWAWKQEYISNSLYNNFYDWFVGDQIASFIQGTKDAGQLQLTGHFEPTIANFLQDCNIPGGCNNYSVQFLEDSAGLLSLVLSSGVKRGGPGFDKRPARASVEITVIINGAVLVLETDPAPADPNIYYEGSQNFNIGFDSTQNKTIHFTNKTNQNLLLNLPGICDVTFGNCYGFGNGVESYKILDEAAKPQFSIGERASAVSVLPYKQANRVASITYSGVYNGETNLNNSNEFNLALANFRDFEIVYGPIMKLYSRETDVLILQEDKISYVLAGKNLLSDAAGGGAITSIPEVLGTQIARIEEYGISFNPESFASFGRNIYFTDTKRNSVIKLSSGAKGDAIEIVSDLGMRSYFRDNFSAQIDTQKLGGYDPYMDEYVLNNNPSSVVQGAENLECGTLVSQTNAIDLYEVTVNIGAIIGIVTLDYLLAAGSPDIQITYTWNGVNTNNVTDGTTTSAGTGVLTDTTANFSNIDIGNGVFNTSSGTSPTPRTTVLAVISATELSLANPNFVLNSGDGYLITKRVTPVITTVLVSGSNPGGSISLNKSNLYPTTINLKVARALSTSTDPLSYQITPNCAIAPAGSITQIVLTSPQQSGKELHYEYQWNDGTFFSPVESNLVRAKSNPLQSVSAFDQTNGFQSQGMIPYLNASHLIRSNKLNTDDLIFNENENKFYIFAQGNPMYAPGATGTSNDFNVTKLAGKSPRTPIQNPQTGLFQATRLNYGMGTALPNLILVTDLRDYSYVKMGYDATSSSAACNVVLNCNPVLTTARETSSYNACQLSAINITRYTNAISAANITIGDILYQNSPCNSNTTNWTDAGFYKISGSTNGRVLRVGNDGLIIQITNC